MDDLGWFVEGVAAYVAGQVDGAHKDDARRALAKGVTPTKLADAWSGKYRYGVCGSMVKFIDDRYGRKVLRKMLTAVTNDQALALLSLSESQFLADWREFVKQQTQN
jgi:hypothetical protein